MYVFKNKKKIVTKINTFKIKKANFEDIWETNFLLFSIPIFIKTLKLLNIVVIFI
jgi:hypothetical protein